MNILQITLSETTLIKLGRNVVELRQNDLGRNGLGAKRPVSYDRYLVWRAFSKTSIFRSKMLFTCGREVQTEKKISIFENIRIRVDGASGVRLLVELYCVIVVKHVAFFAVCATLTMAVTLTSLLLSFCSSVSGCGCGSRFEQKYL